jgi:hypothetical protein
MFESLQSRVLGSVSIIALLFTLLINGVRMGFGGSILFIIMFGISSLIAIFDIHCTLAGGCTIFSWIKTVLLLLSFISLIYIYKEMPKEEPNKKKEEEKPVVYIKEPTRKFEQDKNTLEQFYNLLK